MRKERLELSRLTALEPKSSASTNSATLAGSERLKYRRFKQAAIVSQLSRLRKEKKEIFYVALCRLFYILTAKRKSDGRTEKYTPYI